MFDRSCPTYFGKVSDRRMPEIPAGSHPCAPGSVPATLVPDPRWKSQARSSRFLTIEAAESISFLKPTSEI
jgi:hypothetical protein